MKEIIAKIIKGIKATSFKKKAGVPPFLYGRFNKLVLFSAISACMGLLCFIIGILKTPLSALPFAFLAAGLLFVAFYHKYQIEHNGYCYIEGTVIYTKEMLTSAGDAFKRQSFRRPSYYHIRTEDDQIFRIAANKIDDDIPNGTEIMVYAPLGVETYQRSGINYLVSCWGYEVKAPPKDIVQEQ